ncbi:MAG TPA: glycosyltransferase [Candidatus Lokiarchaeia archaeon]|nr:glycosyltransferase [Candidatus Lokiarchaeia archaeon]
MRQVVWIGRFRGHSGFATATRGYVNALLPRMKNLSIAPLEVLEPEDSISSYRAQLPLRGDEFKVVNHHPTMDPEAECYFSVCEFDRISTEWADILSRARLVLAQSTFCTSIFSEAIGNSANVHVIPYIIPQQYVPGCEFIRLFPEDVFIFGSVFEWVPRKVPERTIQAFTEEFDRDESVRLVLKTSHPDGLDTVQLVKEISTDERIVTITDDFPDLAAFYRGLDTYISCTAGEGYGQTLAEAMACGIPAIASRNGGNLDFMNDDNSYLVDVEDWSLAFTLDGEDYRWRLPKIEAIRERMREVYSHWLQGREEHKYDDTARFRAKFTPDRIGTELRKVILEAMS